ncbi:MAG TPA: DegT/DnrJ/EryC1/StrS family aminotransferase [Longimicrobiales bacterium]|nr:DegT/DnrJ/EryC1/StrS family aminotransferase [Longimicrobiales bacterium]
MASRIYLSAPHLSGLEQQFVLDALAGNWIAPLGPDVDAFEAEFADAIGIGHAAAVSSGTAALHLALRLVGVGPGDEVLVSTLTFIASASPVVFLGARPVFIDSESGSWNLDPALLEQTLEERRARGRLPKAVIVVHLFGQPADLQPMLAVCARYGVPLIEDAAEALGATYDGRAVGTFGLISVFSFNGNKTITTSGGGMLVSADEAMVTRARWLAAQARDPLPHYQHSELGYNYRMSNILAALGRAQLRVLDERVAARRRNARIYRDALADLPGLHLQDEAPWGRHARWLTCLTIDPARAGLDREELRLALEAENIEARPVWQPLHLQPVFADCVAVGGAVAEDLFAKGLCLPSGSSLDGDDLERVITVVRRSFARAGKRRSVPVTWAGTRERDKPAALLVSADPLEAT